MKLFDPDLKFYKGNTHAHSTDSDGDLSPEAVMAAYRAAGYDFLALTDHWHVGRERRYEGMLVLPGVEYDFDYPTQCLHLVCLFPDAADADGITRRTPLREVIGRVNGSGGVAVAAHPAWSLNTPEFLKSLDGVDISEVYNTISDEPFNGPRGNSEGVLDVTAANGKCYRLVAADDAHCYRGEQCVSWVMVQAEALTVPAILEGLRAGRFYATQGPAFTNIEFRDGDLIVETSPVRRVTFCSNQCWVDGRCRSGEGLTREVYHIQPNDTFIRARITDEAGRMAWSSIFPVSNGRLAGT